MQKLNLIFAVFALVPIRKTLILEEWLQCSCNRWIHKDCVDNEDLDESSGRLCPLC